MKNKANHRKYIKTHINLLTKPKRKLLRYAPGTTKRNAALRLKITKKFTQPLIQISEAQKDCSLFPSKMNEF